MHDARNGVGGFPSNSVEVVVTISSATWRTSRITQIYYITLDITLVEGLTVIGVWNREYATETIQCTPVEGRCLH
jgi:hypothetical protein